MKYNNKNEVEYSDTTESLNEVFFSLLTIIKKPLKHFNKVKMVKVLKRCTTVNKIVHA